jgi:RimJ/RimL family protein N-acetyltransferase
MSHIYCHKNGIGLRKVERSDLPILKELKDESWYGTRTTAIVNMDDQERWFDSWTNTNSSLYLIADQLPPTSPPNPIGLYRLLRIDWVSRCYESGHDVFKHARGRRLSNPVLEAGVDFGFEMFNMHRIETEYMPGNISRKAAAYAGFIPEGIRRKAIYKNGIYYDSEFAGLLREEWLELPRVKAYEGVCNTSVILPVEKIQ